MEFKYNKVLIWGYGISGRAVERVLIEIGADYAILDEGERIKGGGFLDKITNKQILDYDLIVLSPGVDIRKKEVQFAIENGIEVISEIEFGYMFLNPKTKVIGITGTNGKTTTVELIYNTLKIAGKKVAELGNIGKPFSDVYGKDYDFVVVELSSFQLELCKRFRANIAVLLNIAPDHIDRHGSYQNYVEAKCKIFNNQLKKDCAIVCEDNTIFDVSERNIVAKKILLSEDNKKGKYYIDKGIIFKSNNAIVDLNVFNISKVFYQDILASFIVIDSLGVLPKDFNKMLDKYSFLSHRCEYVTNMVGVNFYNDSKATNIHAVESCIKSLKEDRLLLMLGGENKSLDFDNFISNLNKKVHRIIVFGKHGKKLFKLRKLKQDVQFYKFKNLHKAMENIDNFLYDVDAVVLSPGCASFDEFSSYIERGDYFKKMVVELRENYESKN